MANHMDAVKTTINVDEETMREFKKMTTSKYGSARKLSAAIEEAMRSYNSTSILSEYAEKEGITLTAYPSSREVRRGGRKLRHQRGWK